MATAKIGKSGAPSLRVRDRRALLRNVVENAAVPTFLAKTNGQVVYANRAFCDLLGYEPNQIVGHGIAQIVHADDAGKAREQTAALAAGEINLYRAQRRYLRKNGDFVWVLSSASVLRNARGRPLYFTVQAVDIDLQKRAEAALAESESRWNFALESAGQGVWDHDLTNKHAFRSNAWRAMRGMDPTEEVDPSPDRWLTTIHPEDRERVLSEVAKHDAGEVDSRSAEFRERHKDGHWIWILSRGKTIEWLPDGKPARIIGTDTDITERKQGEAQILLAAHRDALTGLANRLVFVEAVEQALARAKRDAGRFGVLYLDLDQFKDVNDTLGHAVGDELLKKVAERLRLNARSTDVVARFGGDEFAVLATNISDPSDLVVLAKKLILALSRPFEVGDNSVCSGASIGIALFGLDVLDAETILSRADLALYRAKAEGPGGYRFFTKAMDREVHTRVALGADLREAVNSQQLFLEYQPQIQIATGLITGVEALVRWRHPTRGVLPPSLFIPIAEKNGFIGTVGHWVLREACRQTKEWLDTGIAPRVTAVNLSAVQFKRSFELEADIAAILADTGLPPDRLEIELTETVLMVASHDHNDALQRLREQGIRLAIDDFGVGYSSFDYLRRFPANRIKIAREFIEQIATVRGSAAIVRATIGLARELEMDVIADGIESAEQLELLQAWGCREGQGFYLARPLGVRELEPLLARGRIVPGQQVPARTAA